MALFSRGMGSSTVFLLIVALVTGNVADLASAARVEYHEILASGEHYSVVYPTSSNAIITGYLSAVGSGEGLTFWVTSPSGQRVLGDATSWVGEFTQFEFVAQENGAYTFHVENHYSSSLGSGIKLVIDSRLDQSGTVLIGLAAAMIGVGVAAGLLVWRKKKRRHASWDSKPLRERRKLVRASLGSSYGLGR